MGWEEAGRDVPLPRNRMPNFLRCRFIENVRDREFWYHTLVGQRLRCRINGLQALPNKRAASLTVSVSDLFLICFYYKCPKLSEIWGSSCSCFPTVTIGTEVFSSSIEPLRVEFCLAVTSYNLTRCSSSSTLFFNTVLTPAATINNESSRKSRLRSQTSGTRGGT